MIVVDSFLHNDVSPENVGFEGNCAKETKQSKIETKVSKDLFINGF